eukprot:TRINITY_DN5611_c0_g1_i4.p1 TRINITY_DN5611_c0_g1~~TRINITY_DN5611_c0_g1_i4.p1  ORF type:complete len:185 (-),score=39.25 TRINITY_DN5611_c0_g1_i4:162-716(-)
MCFEDPIQPPTEEAKRWTENLQILFFVHLVFAFIKFFVSPFTGIFELLSCFILYMAYTQLQFCNCVMYIIFCFMNAMTSFIHIGVHLQNGTFFQNMEPLQNFYTAYSLICLIFYAFAIVIAFYAYREYKAIELEGARGEYMGSGSYNPFLTRRNYQSVPQNEPAVSSGGNRGFSAFAGQGTTIG